MNSRNTILICQQHLVHVHLPFILFLWLAFSNSAVGQYAITLCQTDSDALLGIDRNDWAHANLAIVDEGYLHNFSPIDLPCGLESASLTSVDITITLESNTGTNACENIPVFGNVLLNCPLTTNSICTIVQDVLSPGCAFGAGQTTMGTFSLNLNSCGVNPLLTDIIGVDIIPATELLGTCIDTDDAISSGDVVLEYSICVTYTFDQDLPSACTNSIAVSCDDGDPCTENDTEFVSACDNDFVCIPCQGSPLIACNNTIALPCDDGNDCTENDLEIVSACDNTIVCIPCSGDPINTCDVVEVLPCDDGDPCTINDVQSVSACDNSIVCEACSGELSADCSNTIELPCDDGDPCTTSDVSIVSACDENIICMPCQGIIAETCTNTLEISCNDGNDCTENDIEVVDDCDNTIVCVPCQGTLIQPHVCDDGDCVNGTEEWDEGSCSCITTPNILGCTDETSCNYDFLANCNFDCDYSCADCLGEPFGEAIVDECGECVLPDDALRDIGCLDQLFVPNAFTPDSDGINDYFYVQAGRDPVSFEISIYNRFGEVIFYTDDMAFKWTGNINGGQYYGQSQLYVYKIQYSFDIGTVVR
jgi:gliding motility-associated-like protein